MTIFDGIIGFDFGNREEYASRMDVSVTVEVTVKPSKPLVVVCGWCPDKEQKTKAAREAGNDVSHGMCPSCVRAFEALDQE